MEQDKALEETAPEKERFADQQFGATAARDQEKADRELAEEPREGTDKPRAGNKAD